MSIGTTGALIIGGTALAGAGAGLIASGKQAGAATDAANAQLTASREGLAFQREQADRAFNLFGEEQKRFEPFRVAQLRAMGMLEGLADPNSESYAMNRKVGTDAIQKQLASQGLLRSGQQVAGLENLEVGLSNQRAQILSMLAGTGAGAQSAQMGQNVGGQLMANGERVGSSLSQQGQIIGQGILNAGNASAQAWTGVNNALQSGVGNGLNIAMLRKFGMLS